MKKALFLGLMAAAMAFMPACTVVDNERETEVDDDRGAAASRTTTTRSQSTAIRAY